MKKTVKIILLVIIIASLLFLLTACGEDKLVATKTTEDATMGNYKEEIVMTFKNDKVDQIEMAMEFDSEETASSMFAVLNMGISMSEDNSLEGVEFTQESNKITMTMNASTYAESEGISEENLTKDALRASLEADGYTVE